MAKVLIIGAARSGKSTLLNALQIACGQEYTFEEVPENRDVGNAAYADAEQAILVVSTPDGVVGTTRTLAESVSGQELKLVVFLNKMDLVDDEDLLELTQTEILEVLDSVGCDEDSVAIASGSALNDAKFDALVNALEAW